MEEEEDPDYSERCYEETSASKTSLADSIRDAGNDSTNMLYDILVYREWPKTALEPHSNLIANSVLSSVGPNGVSSQEGNGLTHSTFEWFLSFWPFNWSSPSSVKGLPSKVLSLFDQRIAWRFSLSDDGSALAVLQDHLLEIFSAKDNFATALGRIRLSQPHGQSSKDPYPSFRLLTWSPDASLLVLTSSHGNVDIYDSYGFHVYSIFSSNMPRKEYFNGAGLPSQMCGNAYVGAYFTDVRVKSRDWLCELILVDYSGYVNSFLLSPSGFQEFTSFLLTQNNPQFNNCISAATFTSKHNLLCIASPTSSKVNSGNESAYEVASAYGLTVWRLLNEDPFYAKAILSNDDNKIRNSWSRFSLFQSSNGMEEAIYAMEESPDGSMLCALHSSGDISLWHLPSLRLNRKISLEMQPGHDDMNPNLLQNPKMKRKKKLFLKNPLRWMPLSIKWWNEESIVVGRYSGGVSIIKVLGSSSHEEDISQMRNILGESAEFFSGPPSFSKCFDNGFFVLECDTFTRCQAKTSISKECADDDMEDETRNIEQGGGGGSGMEESDDSEDDEEEESSLYVRGKRTLTAVAYLVTESERFAPPRKRPRVMMKSYKMLSLISTTPEELYARKIEMEEYGEALIMAQHYGLDSDHVYDRQWRLSNLSVVAIKDYLGKIKRRSLVLRECLHAVPNDVEAVRELLNYGLAETGLDVLVKLGEKGQTADDAKYIFPHENVQSDDYESYYLSEGEIAARAEHKENELMDCVTWANLTLSQRDLLATRRILLKYLHRLESYMAIIEEDHSDFDRKFYMRYRNQLILKSAIEFSRSGQIRAVATVLERYGSDLRNYYLIILSNLPESLSPEEYYDLVPKVDNHNSGKVLLPQHITSFEEAKFGTSVSSGIKRDWSELEFVRKCVEQKNDDECGIDSVQGNEVRSSSIENEYRTNQREKGKHTILPKRPKFYFNGNCPSRDLVAKWVDTRVREIEKQSSLVDHALTLLQIASNNGIRVDPRLHHNLLTLEMMMYDLHRLGPSVTNFVSLKRLEEMSDLEVVDKLMGTSTKVNFLNNVNKIFIPYLDRLESLESGARTNLLRNYLLHMSATSLVLPFELIKYGAASTPTSSSGSPNQPGQIFMSVKEYVSIGIDCIYTFEANDSNCRVSPNIDDDDDTTTGNEKKEICNIVMELASFLRKRCRNPHVSNELAEIVTTVKAGKVLKEKYGIVKSLHYLRSSKTQQKQMEDLLLQVTRRAEGKRPKLSGKDWFEVLQDLFELRLAFPVVNLYYCIEVLCESLLCSENTENIRLVEEMFEYSPADALFKGKSSMLYTLSVYKIGTIPRESKVNVVAKACEHYFDSSKDVDDKNLGLAKHCLNLVEKTRSSPNGEKTSNPLCKYYSLLSALDMLAEFGVSILPIVLRNAASSRSSLHQVIEKVLEVDSTSYKNVRKILKLVRHLNDSRDNFDAGTSPKEERNNDAEFLQKKENENSVLALVAEYALKENDYEACFGICEILMESLPAGNKHAVKTCLDLANSDEFVDFQQAKSRMASFCVNYCPDGEIEDMVCRRIDLGDDMLLENQPPKASGVFPLISNLQMLSMRPSIPDVVLPIAAIEISKSVANIALDKIAAVPDKTPVSVIPSAAVDISKSLATVVAAGTNVATETGTRAISSFFGRLGGVISLGTSSPTTTVDESNEMSDNGDDASIEDKETDKKVEAEKIKENTVREQPKVQVPTINVDDFYESVLLKKDKLAFFGENHGKVPLEDYSSSSSLGVDSDTLNLLSRHYRNAIDNEYENEIEWQILQDIILTILNEDASLGISLLLAELLEKQKQTVIIEEMLNDQTTKEEADCDVTDENKSEEHKDCDNDLELESNLNENDGWENNWSDNDLCDLSDDNGCDEDEKEKEVKVNRAREVNLGEKLMDDLINHSMVNKSVGVDLALYLVSLAVILVEMDGDIGTALKVSPKKVIAVAQKYTKRKYSNDKELEENENVCRLLVKTVEMAKLALEEN